MWNQRSVITIFISIFVIVDSSLICSRSYSYPRNFTFNQPCCEPPPAVITQVLNTSRFFRHGEAIPSLNVTVTGVREDFNLTLLAIPQKKSVSTIQGFPINKTADCPRRINKTMDVHQYLDTCVMTTDKGNGEHVKTFDFIFTGCYYVLMTNSKRVSWQSEPKFHNTTYYYRNTKIEHDVPRISPANHNGNMQLETIVSIPLPCIEVTAKIFELNKTSVKKDSQIIHRDIFQNIIKPSEECTFSQNGATRSCLRLDITKNLSFTASKLGASGEVLLKWASLTRGGGVYYLRFFTNTWNCSSGVNFINITDYQTWVPLIRDIFLPIGVKNESVEVGSNVNYIGEVSLGLVVMLGVALAAVFAYFINEYYQVRKALREKEKIEEFLTYAQVFDEEELKQILLIYARGSPQFMTEMRKFRYRLGKECNCRVHDVFSAEDFTNVAKLGAHEWVTKLLIDGSKVVWVDTPELRSHFNDKEKQHPSDSRDAAIPFAIQWAMSLFQNPTTQYRCHFVVRVKGFKVEDRRDDDPLRVVSPHARYHIPGNFSRLCRDITTSVTPKYKQNPEV